MKTSVNHTSMNEMEHLIKFVRAEAFVGNFDDCTREICRAMEAHPNEPEPHNLYGIVLEKMGDHHTAMRHFRAALALDPTYMPARHNLIVYGTFYTDGKCAYDDSDLR